MEGITTIKPTITGMAKLEEVEKEPDKVIPSTTFHKRRFIENEISLGLMMYPNLEVSRVGQVFIEKGR